MLIFQEPIFRIVTEFCNFKNLFGSSKNRFRFLLGIRLLKNLFQPAAMVRVFVGTQTLCTWLVEECCGKMKRPLFFCCILINYHLYNQYTLDLHLYTSDIHLYTVMYSGWKKWNAFWVRSTVRSITNWRNNQHNLYQLYLMYE